MARWLCRTILLCLYMGHMPKRYSAIGGFICGRCGKIGADLDDLGFLGESYVSPHVLAKLESHDRNAKANA